MQFSNHERYIFRTHFISKCYWALSLASVWGAVASDWRPTVLYPGVTHGTCLLQIILASVQVTGDCAGVTGVVRRQGAASSRVSVTLRSLSRQLWGGETLETEGQFSDVITTWDSGRPRIMRTAETRPRLRQQKQNSIQKMRDLGNKKKWTALFMFSF